MSLDSIHHSVGVVCIQYYIIIMHIIMLQLTHNIILVLLLFILIYCYYTCTQKL